MVTSLRLLTSEQLKELRAANLDVTDAAEEVDTACGELHTVVRDEEQDREMIEQALADLEDACVRARDEADTCLTRTRELKALLA